MEFGGSLIKFAAGGVWDMLVSVRVQALTEMAAKLPEGYE